jgi:hypothetical protein
MTDMTPHAREPLAHIRSLAGSLHTIRKTASDLSRRAETGDEGARDRHAQIQSKLIGDLSRFAREVAEVEAVADDLDRASQILLGTGPEASPVDGPAATLARDAVKTKSPALVRIAERLAIAARAGRDQASAARKRFGDARPALDETEKLLALQTEIHRSDFDLSDTRVVAAKAEYRAALAFRKSAQRKSK